MKSGRTKPSKIYGFEVLEGRLVIRENEATIVRQMFADYLGGLGNRAIANKLNDAGIPQPNREDMGFDGGRADLTE